MSDFDTFQITLTRSELGLDPLDLNDHLNYVVSDKIFGAQQTWNRQTVKSPFVDGEFTTHRAKAQRQEQLGIQVFGDDQVKLNTNINALTDAVSQFRFQLTTQLDTQTTTYQCETGDYTLDWDRTRWMAHQVLVTLNIPIYPGVVIT